MKPPLRTSIGRVSHERRLLIGLDAAERHIHSTLSFRAARHAFDLL